MIEQETGLAGHLADIKGVLHQKKHIQIVGLRFVGDERAKGPEPGNLAGRESQSESAVQPRRNNLALSRARCEPRQGFR